MGIIQLKNAPSAGCKADGTSGLIWVEMPSRAFVKFRRLGFCPRVHPLQYTVTWAKCQGSQG